MTARWRGRRFMPHAHDYVALSFNDAGRGGFDCGGTIRDARPGTCSLIAPGQVHTGFDVSGAGWAYRNLHVDVAHFRRWLQDAGLVATGPIRFHAPSVDDPDLAGRLTAALESLTTPTSPLRRDECLLALVRHLGSRHLSSRCDTSGARVGRRQVQDAREYLDAHVVHPVSLARLSALAGCSAFALVRAFRHHVGMTPHRYQMVARLHRARRLMLDGTTPAEAAHLSGFCDQSHMHRWFTRVFGVTPGRYAPSRVATRSVVD